jgi:outer membrane protein
MRLLAIRLNFTIKQSDFNFLSVKHFDRTLFEVLKINMSTFNRSIPLLALGMCLALMSGPASAEIKMGVVNFQKLLEDAPQTKTAMQALENEFAPRRRELLTMQNDLKARDEKLQKEGAVMSEADRAKAEKALRDQQREFSRKAGEFQDDASTRRNEEIGKVQRYLVTEIQAYGNAQGYDLVLGDGVFFAKGPLDITANVLALLATKPASLPAAAPGAAPAKAPTAIPPAKTPGK